MPDENLTAALRVSLQLEDEGTSPLAEVTADAVDELLARIEQNLIEGVPSKITDAELSKAVDMYRAQALYWAQQEQQKAAKPRAARGTAKQIDLSKVVEI